MRSSSSLLRLGVALFVALMVVGCGSDGEDRDARSSDGPRSAPVATAEEELRPETRPEKDGSPEGEAPPTRSERQSRERALAAQLRGLANEACARASRGNAAPPPQDPAELGRYAAEALNRARPMVAALGGIRVQPTQRMRIEPLQRAYGALIPLYSEVIRADAAEERDTLRRLAPAIRAAEAGVARLARSLALPACAPR